MAYLDKNAWWRCAVCSSKFGAQGSAVSCEKWCKEKQRIGQKVEEHPVVQDQPSPVLLDDQVNSPEHYRAGTIECIDAIQAMTGQFQSKEACYLLGNALKYIWRHERKGDPIKDLKKAIWYIERRIKEIEEK